MLKKATRVLLCLLALAPLQGAFAASVVYSMNRVVNNGTISGTITTDGTTGILQSSNIIDWNLTINADSDEQTVGRLFGPLSGNNSSLNFFPSSALFAINNGSISTLSFDFGTPSSEIFQLATPNNEVVWQMQAGAPFQAELIREAFPFFVSPIQAFESRGPVIISLGTANLAPTVSQVPLPASGLLLLSGLGALGLVKRRKS